MKERRTKTRAPVASRLELPAGVNAADWALERVTVQNPSIRALLGCLRVLEGVLESNYAILHCSPQRVLELNHQVRKVASLLRTEVAPLLEAPSVIADLASARQGVRLGLSLLEGSILARVDAFPEPVPDERLHDLRKLMCVATGKVMAFLQDALGAIMSADPRSAGDREHFPSREFAREVEEAEWLYASVRRLEEYLNQLEGAGTAHVTAVLDRLRSDRRVPRIVNWRSTAAFLDKLVLELTPKLREVIVLRGIRIDELELIDRYARELPTACSILAELHEAGCEAISSLKAATGGRGSGESAEAEMVRFHALFSERMARLLGDIDEHLKDLRSFVPLWRQGVEQRRALLSQRE